MLAGLDIAGDHRGGPCGREHAAGRQDDLQRLPDTPRSSGMSSSTRVRKTPRAAASTMAEGALKLDAQHAAGAGEVQHRLTGGRIDADPHDDLAAAVLGDARGAVGQRLADGAADARASALSCTKPHIAAHGFAALRGRSWPPRWPRRSGSGGDLGLEVGDILDPDCAQASGRRSGPRGFRLPGNRPVGASPAGRRAGRLPRRWCGKTAAWSRAASRRTSAWWPRAAT